MMICPNCKSNIPEDSKFCPDCGTALKKSIDIASPSVDINSLRSQVEHLSQNFSHGYMYYVVNYDLPQYAPNLKADTCQKIIRMKEYIIAKDKEIARKRELERKAEESNKTELEKVRREAEAKKRAEETKKTYINGHENKSKELAVDASSASSSFTGRDLLFNIAYGLVLIIAPSALLGAAIVPRLVDSISELQGLICGGIIGTILFINALIKDLK